MKLNLTTSEAQFILDTLRHLNAVTRIEDQEIRLSIIKKLTKGKVIE